MTALLADPMIANSGPHSTLSNPDMTGHYFGRRVWNVESIRIDAAPHDFRIAEMADLPAAHQFCEMLMGMRLAPLWALASAHAHTQATAWVHEDSALVAGEGRSRAVTGVYLILPLNWDGEAALRTRRFNFAAPRIDELCAPGDEIAAMYFWFCGGSDRIARRNIMRTTQAWLDGACADLRIYGRAASADGERGFASFGFKRLAPDRPDLFILNHHR